MQFEYEVYVVAEWRKAVGVWFSWTHGNVVGGNYVGIRVTYVSLRSLCALHFLRVVFRIFLWLQHFCDHGPSRCTFYFMGIDAK